MCQNAYLVNNQTGLRQNAYLAKYSNWHIPKCIFS